MPPEPKATEVWFPVPAKVTPGATPGAPPSDAIVLFDGKNRRRLEERQWRRAGGLESGRWRDGRGARAPATSRRGEKFGDVQLHIEWCAPQLPPDKVNQDRGNSGVFLQDVYEVQVLDTFENKTYVNGQVGRIYKQYPPLVNALTAGRELADATTSSSPRRASLRTARWPRRRASRCCTTACWCRTT